MVQRPSYSGRKSVFLSVKFGTLTPISSSLLSANLIAHVYVETVMCKKKNADERVAIVLKTKHRRICLNLFVMTSFCHKLLKGIHKYRS